MTQRSLPVACSCTFRDTIATFGVGDDEELTKLVFLELYFSFQL